MYTPPIIPGPNNELVYQSPKATGSYTTSVDFATSASYAATASYTLGFIVSSSYANFASTASYLLGSIATAVSASWANFSGHSITSDSASWAQTASYALTASYVEGGNESSSYSITSSYSSFSQTSISSSYALTASYVDFVSSESSSYLSGSSATIQKMSLVSNSGSTSYTVMQHVTDIEFATAVDQFPDTDGSAVRWLVSIFDGTSFKVSEIIAVWDAVTNVTNFAEVTTNTIGTIPVSLSVNISGNNVRLIVNPASGTWTIKVVRMVL